MPSLEEIAGAVFASSPMNAALDAGIDAIAGSQRFISFQRYTRKILPLDGFVFWVKTADAPIIVEGSLHLASERTQNETESMSKVAVIFTSKADASQSFNSLGPADILIGTVSGDIGLSSGNAIRLAFSRLGFYANAGLFHYSGMAIYKTMQSQIIEDPTTFDVGALVASNSLPAWLSLNDYTPFYGFGNAIPLFPSFLIAPNFTPPYGAVHVYPDSTNSMASAPILTRRSSHFNLAKERVKITLYGVDNADAISFVDCFLQYSDDYNILGLMNSPIVKDEKDTQVELGIASQKKSIDFEVNYLQSAMRDIARQTIQIALASVLGVDPIYRC